MEGYEITVIKKDGKVKIRAKAGDTLLKSLRDAGLFTDAPCAGRGRCGKCAVKFIENAPAITDEDREFFSDEQLCGGIRLSCRAIPSGDCAIEFPDEGFDTIDAVSEFKAPKDTCRSSGYKAAADIGTTTAALALLDGQNRIIATDTFANPQHAFGADVISRISAANEGKLSELSRLIRLEFYRSLGRLAQKGGISLGQIESIATAGNTAMVHMLMGYSCEGLGSYPFEPVTLEEIKTDPKALFLDPRLGAKMTILPGISAFVGADITAGLLHLGFGNADRPSVFIDFGTNCEMAIGRKGEILVCSAAAGPAFEGGNISCGMAGVSGAVCGVDIDNENVKLRTINDTSPLGICGSGVVELAFELKKNGIMDETGLLAPGYFETGFPLARSKGHEIVFTQSDIRSLQLAKAAVRAGIETLLLNYGALPKDIDRVYMAGGFGMRMDAKKAVGIGLIPKELTGKTAAAGNTSLGGCADYLADDDAAAAEAALIAKSARCIELSESEDFKRAYIEMMAF